LPELELTREVGACVTLLEVKGTPKEPNALEAAELSCLPFTPGTASGISTGEFPLAGWTELVSGGGNGFTNGLALSISD
jgi:hypothetical protein